MMLRITTIMLAAAVLSLTGCRDREITSYQAPKDPAPKIAEAPGGMPPGHPPIDPSSAPADPGAMTGTVPVAQGVELSWTAPANWTPKTPTAMRKASYSVAGEGGAVGDLAVTAFPGDTGGLFANVNRWRGQVGLPPLAEAEVEASVQHLEVNEFKIVLVDVAGKAGGQPTRLVGAIIPFNGQTWFFKLMGPDAVVTREKPAFREFLNTIKPR